MDPPEPQPAPHLTSAKLNEPEPLIDISLTALRKEELIFEIERNSNRTIAESP
jgi:hypothetical protein